MQSTGFMFDWLPEALCLERMQNINERTVTKAISAEASQARWTFGARSSGNSAFRSPVANDSVVSPSTPSPPASVLEKEMSTREILPL